MYGDRPYYVYVHSDPITKKPFYVGKGKADRAFKKDGRNADWHKIAENGISVSFPEVYLKETCAFCIERMLIAAIGLENLCNRAPGGPGIPSWGFSKTIRARMSASNRCKKKSEAHRSKMSSGTREAWKDPLYRKIHSISIRKKEKFTFSHPEHGDVLATRYEMKSQYGFSSSACSSLIKGTYKSWHKWRIIR